MHLSKEPADTAQVHRLPENLVERLGRSREWAAPAVESALRRAMAGIDNGVDVASPRLQTLLRAIADELAGGMETATPGPHERISRILLEAGPPDSRASRTRRRRTPWWTLVVAVVATATGVALWRALHPGQPSVDAATDPDGADQLYQ